MRTIKDIENLIQSNPNLFLGLKKKPTEKFIEWYPLNMHVINRFEDEAVFLKRNGNRDFYSCYTIREKLRWDSLLREKENVGYKLNNNFSPFIARVVMALNPELQGMFQTRETQMAA